MRRILNLFALCTLLALLIGPQAAYAQLTFNLTPAGQQGNQGATLTFTATLENIGTDPLFLNGTGASLTGDGLTLDTSPFFLNSPLSMNAGDTWSGAIFTVGIAPSALPGDYTGRFAIIGGFDDAAQDTLTAQNYLVTVALTDSAVPEPGTLAVLLIGIATTGASVALRRRCGR